ncbi:MAG: bifunctional hydroxymethylpyrimidine kinase/phosphomethylpyrimidine kinase [Bacteroidales bacterium]
MNVKRYPVALTIAGSDSGGGAGIQADLKSFSALGVYGTSVITAITAQNTQGVTAVESVTPAMVRAQAEAIFSDIHVDAVKIGMLHSPEIIRTVAALLDTYKPTYVILDPVMIATSGDKLIQDDCVNLILTELFPKASLVTPNLDEAEFLTGMKIHDTKTLELAGKKLLSYGCKAVLMKGGHLPSDDMTDLLIYPDGTTYPFSEKKISSKNTHGTGCTFSSAIAAHLSHGLDLKDAVAKSKSYITKALFNGADIQTGKGHGPLNHFFQPVSLQEKQSKQ